MVLGNIQLHFGAATSARSLCWLLLDPAVQATFAVFALQTILDLWKMESVGWDFRESKIVSPVVRLGQTYYKTTSDSKYIQLTKNPQKRVFDLGLNSYVLVILHYWRWYSIVVNWQQPTTTYISAEGKMWRCDWHFGVFAGLQWQVVLRRFVLRFFLFSCQPWVVGLRSRSNRASHKLPSKQLTLLLLALMPNMWPWFYLGAIPNWCSPMRNFTIIFWPLGRRLWWKTLTRPFGGLGPILVSVISNQTGASDFGHLKQDPLSNAHWIFARHKRITAWARPWSLMWIPSLSQLSSTARRTKSRQLAKMSPPKIHGLFFSQKGPPKQWHLSVGWFLFSDGWATPGTLFSAARVCLALIAFQAWLHPSSTRALDRLHQTAATSALNSQTDRSLGLQGPSFRSVFHCISKYYMRRGIIFLKKIKLPTTWGKHKTAKDDAFSELQFHKFQVGFSRKSPSRRAGRRSLQRSQWPS